eukprot:1160691-Pelagomonas_calceolata.AAC.4
MSMKGAGSSHGQARNEGSTGRERGEHRKEKGDTWILALFLRGNAKISRAAAWDACSHMHILVG